MKHDDWLDSLAMAVGHFKNSLQRDEKKALESYKQKVTAEWIKEALGCSRKGRPKFFKA